MSKQINYRPSPRSFRFYMLKQSRDRTGSVKKRQRPAANPSFTYEGPTLSGTHTAQQVVECRLLRTDIRLLTRGISIWSTSSGAEVDTDV